MAWEPIFTDFPVSVNLVKFRIAKYTSYNETMLNSKFLHVKSVLERGRSFPGLSSAGSAA